MSLVELARYYTKVEGDLVQLLLGSHGIEAILFDAGLNNVEGGGLATPVRLMVLDDDLAAAEAILAKDQDERKGAN